MGASKGVIIRPFVGSDIPSMARLHASAFARGWSRDEFRGMLAIPGTDALIADDQGVIGFLLYRIAADESEIFTIVVSAGHRRRGIGSRLIEALFAEIPSRGLKIVFLEVEEDNLPAQALYRQYGFTITGRRNDYYAQGRDQPADALVMKWIRE